MIKPKISVCIPTYNGEKYIEQTILSLIEQTYQDIEIIICDDLSIDSTVDKVKSFNDERIQIHINKERLGMVENWNNCFQYASGKYILFLFQDDVIEKNCIEEKVKVLEENTDTVLVFSASKVIDENGDCKLKRRPFKKTKIFEGSSEVKRFFRYKNIFAEPSNVIYRKDICDKVGKFNKELIYTPDWEYSLRCIKFGKFIYLDLNLSSFRISRDSMTANLLKNKKRLKDDDKKFVVSIEQIYKGQIKKMDIVLHKIFAYARFTMKLIFNILIINNKGNKNE